MNVSSGDLFKIASIVLFTKIKSSAFSKIKQNVVATPQVGCTDLHCFSQLSIYRYLFTKNKIENNY